MNFTEHLWWWVNIGSGNGLMPSGNKTLPEPESCPRSLIPYGVTRLQWVNMLRPRQNGRYFADDVFKCIFLNENVWILLKISLKFVPKIPINNIPVWVKIMTLRRSGDKPSSEPVMVSLLTHECVTRSQCVNRDIIALLQMFHAI